MKLLTLSTVIAALFLSSCSKEDLTPNKQTEALLRAQIWELEVCKIDGVLTNKYDGLTLSFGTGIYSTTNGGSLWPASGTWDFVGDKGDIILRDDGLEITVVSASAANLVMTFFWDTTVYDGGRIGSISGNHEMTFRRKP